MGINEWVKKIHQCALDHGWWVDKEEDPKNMTPEARLSKHMLMVTEIAEASEEVRNGKAPLYWNNSFGYVQQADAGGAFNLWEGEKLLKPEGELVELADVVIRIMDYAGFMGWDLEQAINSKHNYNLSREFRHGGKAL